MPPSGRQREQHDTDEAFARAVGKHALAEAKKKKGGQTPTEPVTLDATVTIAPEGSWTVCLNLGIISICRNFDGL